MTGESLKSRMVDKIISVLRDNVGEEAGVIKAGPLQDSPLKQRISVLQHDMDPLDPKNSEWVDRHYSAVPGDKRRFQMAPDEGHIQGWVLRGVLEIVINLGATREDRDEGYVVAEDFRENVMSLLMHAGIPGTVSGSGEWTAFFFTPTKIATIEQGGKGSWMWRYYIYYECYGAWDPFAKENMEARNAILQY